MNNGRISSRYAKVLYLTAVEVKEEEKVYNEVKLLNDNLFAFPYFKKLLINRIVTNEEKVDILKTAAGKEVSVSLAKFLPFVAEKERLEYIHYIALEYLKLYRKEKNIVAIKLITAVKLDEKLLQRIKQLIEEQQKAEVEIIEKIDDSIIGGFIFEMDGQRLDASVTGELKKIREDLLKKS
jgi:F-type H+-transporting ATPase subunit delta